MSDGYIYTDLSDLDNVGYITLRYSMASLVDEIDLYDDKLNYIRSLRCPPIDAFVEELKKDYSFTKYKKQLTVPFITFRIKNKNEST